MQNTDAKNKIQCPDCNSSNTRIIVYGLVTGVNLRDKSQYHYAGCIFQPFKYVCYECDYHWGDIWGIK